MHIILASCVLLSVGADPDFDPVRDVSACLVWFDATDTDADGRPDVSEKSRPVKQWSDKSGRGNHATQAEAARRPAYVPVALRDKPALRFDGNDCLISSAVHDWSSDWTLFVVASLSYDTPNSWRGIVGNRFGAGKAHWWTLGTKSDGTTYLELAAGKGVFSTVRPAGAGPQLYSVVRNGNAFVLNRNGAEMGRAAMAHTGGKSNELRIGQWCSADQGWKGEIAEVIVYDRTLTEAERKRVEAYLATKWGVATPPNLYAKRATWAETMLATRSAYQAWRNRSDFEPFETAIVRGGQAPVRVSVDVSELNALHLVATDGGDGYHRDIAVWAEARLIAKDGKTVRLSGLEPTSVRVGWGRFLKDKTAWDKPITIGKRRFEHGLFAHAPSELCFALGKRFDRFEAWVGMDAEAADKGTVRFLVLDRPDPLQDLWTRLRNDFPGPCKLLEEDAGGAVPLDWLRGSNDIEAVRRMVGPAGPAIGKRREALTSENAPPSDVRWLELILDAAKTRARFRSAKSQLQRLNLPALERAIRDLITTFGDDYPRGDERLKRLDGIAKELPTLSDALARCDEAALQRVEKVLAFRRKALLANPLLDFDELLVVKRRMVPNAKGHGGHVRDPYGLPQNWQSNSSIRSDVWDNELAVLSPIRPDGKLETLYKPEGPYFVGDVDLDFDADKILFSSVGAHKRWHVFEIRVDGTGVRQVTPGDHADVNYYDACYLPDGRILFTSTATIKAVPCVNGSSLVANLYRMDADGSGIRQLCFDQEHNWCPTVLNNGRVLYARWEYTDTPHAHARLMFHMNPDGTEQMEYYGSNSYWPNSMFYARPIPGHPTQFVAIVSGHHGVRRMGELVLFDPARGRREADGVVQRIPGWGEQVEPKIEDNLVDASWPKFLHPYPLGEHETGRGGGKYFLASAQPTPESEWGIYLVDVFDNMLLLREEPGYVLFEPIPLRTTPRPPVIPDKIKPGRKDAVVYLADVYAGDGLKGVPRGAVKELRLFSYVYLYPGMGGPQGVVGLEGPWDIKRILGTVPVLDDGSAVFKVPANTPIAVQPLDDEGKALQLMRSWFTAMPGEVLSCVGCHERQATTPEVRTTLASTRRPDDIEPWYGPTRGFSFPREVQRPVIDRYCVGCHNGKPRPDGKQIADLRGHEKIKGYKSVFHYGGRDAGHFSTSYAELHRYVRRPGLESDYHLLTPLEYHADTTQLVQMLAKGHHGVRLDAEAWDRLVTWIDLNAPYHGTWTEIAGKERVAPKAKRRRELRKLYAGMDDDFEWIPPTPSEPVMPVQPKPPPVKKVKVTADGWPFDEAQAKIRQASVANRTRRSVDLGEGQKIDLVLIPPGAFVMGSDAGYPDERPRTAVRIERPFWLGTMEVTNAQFARFDPYHDSKVESKHAMQFGVRGFYVNKPQQQVVRVSWRRAVAFCDWLTERIGERFTLPTEAQWEYACRAGSATALSFGPVDADYSRQANLADKTLLEFVAHPYRKERVPMKNPYPHDDWIPRDDRFRDNGFVSEPGGRYRPNAWGLHDMHGNVAEWTRSLYRPYPYREDDGRNDPSAEGRRVTRGGSWRDRPKRARSAMRVPYRSYQCVYNVGFRVMCEASAEKVVRVSAHQ